MTGTAINSVQLEQDHDWRPRHTRLWGAHAPRPVLVPLPPPEPEPEPEPIPEPPNGAPVDFKATGQKFIAAYVAAKHGLHLSDLVGPRRIPLHVRARREAMFMVRTHTERSLQEIGKFFGGRHHTSVHVAIRNYSRLDVSDE